MNGVRLPLAFSVVGHAAVLAAIAWLAARPLPVPKALPLRTVAVVFTAPPTPVVVPPPPPPPPPLPAPPPPPPVAAVQPPPPPPRPKPVIEHRPVRVVRPRVLPPPKPPRPQPETPPPPQVAALPPPAPRPAPPAPVQPVISAAWRAELGAWLQSHKTYPEMARQRGEEGEAVLRFRVDRSGRVLDYAVVRSTGHPDLDAAVREMMQGATLPAFPASMPQPQIQVSVAVRFALR